MTPEPFTPSVGSVSLLATSPFTALLCPARIRRCAASATGMSGSPKRSYACARQSPVNKRDTYLVCVLTSQVAPTNLVGA